MLRFMDVDIYPVTGRNLYAGRSDEDVIAQLAAGGAKIVQLREKNITGREYFNLAALYRRETSRHGMTLIINDRPDIALAVGADGVHLGREDMPVSAARKIMGPHAIIGGSSHNVEQAIQAERSGATYVNIGPLFSTPTKPDAEPVGLSPVREAVGKLHIPFTVMGGIVEGNLDQVLLAGARHIGVITAIFGDKDITAATHRLAQKIHGFHHSAGI